MRSLAWASLHECTLTVSAIISSPAPVRESRQTGWGLPDAPGRSGRFILKSVNEQLMRAVLYAALFFETCSEEQCDLDTAVKQLEGIAAELDGLTTANKAEFRAFVLSEAAAHPVPAVSKEIAELIDTLLAED